jgi:hypothetical protein
MPSRFDRAAAVTEESLSLAAVPVVATLLSTANVARALEARGGGGVTFPFPSGLPTLWTYVSLPGGTGGRDAYLGLSAPIDFEDAFAPPEVETLADRGIAAGHEVAFLSMHPVVEDEAGLAALVASIRARRRGGRAVPEHTAAAVEELGLELSVADGQRRVVSGE